MASIIKNRAIVGDDWTLVRAAEDGTLPAVEALPAGKVIVCPAQEITSKAFDGPKPKTRLFQNNDFPNNVAEKEYPPPSKPPLKDVPSE